jgi:hypothetical protein
MVQEISSQEFPRDETACATSKAICSPFFLDRLCKLRSPELGFDPFGVAIEAGIEHIEIPASHKDLRTAVGTITYPAIY